MISEKYGELAKRVPLFNGLDAEDVAKIFSKGMTMEVEKGNVLFYQGTTGNQMYVVLGGRIDLFDGKKHLTSLRTGDLFGEMAVILNEPRSASAVAGETSRVFVLSETVFEKLMTKRAAIRILLNIIGVMARRIREMNTKLAEARASLAQTVPLHNKPAQPE
ncbi:MAG TPA: cyclic nucleotide-binding domain-containing protein [Candidatus Hydrogenedentes bacterium]|nr:cyclic nucleotide-binding domain-containing protein [Candidatus Hydrogenedentota bacterium]